MSQEILDILQEECAEVIQAVSKVRRFGWENHHPDRELTNRQELEEELGDLLAMIELLVFRNMVNRFELDKAKHAKIAKLKRYTRIFED